jgi:hypothetical protein
MASDAADDDGGDAPRSRQGKEVQHGEAGDSTIWLPARLVAPNFVAVRLTQTENRTQQAGNPGNVG